MDGRGDVDGMYRRWQQRNRRKKKEEIIIIIMRNVIFIFTLRTNYAYVEVYESTVQIRETHFHFRFHFKRLEIANPKIRKFRQTASKHHS